MVSLLIKLLLVACVAKAFQNLPLRGKLRPHSEGSQSSSSSGSVGGPTSWQKSRGQKALLNVHWGIPKLFRWLVDLYPIVLDSVGDGLTSDKASPVDNFYLDMNGIIHTCTHSNNDKLIALDEKAMFHRIFAYTDRLYKLVKPRNKMFLAIDGVAPRAKMNQQRSRRFRSSKERAALMADYIAKEGKLPDDESFDSNCITPGTEFMFRLGLAFRRWIAYKMKTDKFWQNGAEIIFSGPEVPGEGEHKVMDMFRADRAADPNYERGQMKHCMYGLDADLIMLSLVTHEPRFVLLREKIQRRKGSAKPKDSGSFSAEDFELLEISILRKMLQQHFAKMGQGMDEAYRDAVNNRQEKLPPKFSLERLIDDFVFMCMFVGNDFLPCLPHLDIADGSLNLMMNVYRDIMPTLGGYLTDKSRIHMPRVELFIQEIGRREPLYFQQRATDEKEPRYADDGYKDFYYQHKLGFIDKKQLTKEEENSAIDSAKAATEGDIEVFQGITKHETVKENKSQLIKSYIEGLAWVLEYYHNGCGSWTWYYPYLYAPLASDLRNLGSIPLVFEQGEPFTPLMQLLSVLPPQSGSFLPPSYERLMVSPDSPLQPYYPPDFTVDPNGKKNSWEAVVQIPFINEGALVKAVSKIDHLQELKKTERLRNIQGVQHSFKPKRNQLGTSQ